MKTSDLESCLRKELLFFPTAQETLEMSKLMKPDVDNFIKYENFRKLVKYLASDDYFSK